MFTSSPTIEKVPEVPSVEGIPRSYRKGDTFFKEKNGVYVRYQES
jgi:hypothetical protein